jgi:hypothetical protein
LDKRTFPLGTVLSITTGRLFAPNGMEGVYGILNWLTQDSLYTHQLPRVSEECKPWILKQHPQLVGVDDAGVTTDNWRAWLTDQVLRFGETVELEQMPAGEHYYIDPLSELAEKVHPSRIAVVQVGKAER